MPKLLLTLSAIYVAIIGVSLIFVPVQFGIGAVPADASPELIALLRLLGGPLLGIATLNWLSRGADPSTLRAVVIANVVGFGLVAANDVWSVFRGEARDLAKVFLVVHVLLTAGFVIAWRRLPGRRG